LGPALAPKVLLDFISKEGNILLALSGETSTPVAISSLLLELDIALPTDKGTVTVDHFNYDTLSATEKHDVLLLSQPSPRRSDVKSFFGGSGLVAFPRAVSQVLANSTPLLNSILKAKSTTYTYNTKDDAETVEDPFAVGEQISLVTAMQARNSARFTVFGSAEALQNSWFDASVKGVKGGESKTANRQFAKQVTQWAFKETGVLKVGQVQHYLTEVSPEAGNNSVSKVGNLNPTIYRIKNDVVS
jgi:oligosaccharyltransferase complex subunit beta